MTPITSTQLMSIITSALKEVGAFPVTYENLQEKLLESLNERRVHPLTELPAQLPPQDASTLIADYLTEHYGYGNGTQQEEMRDFAETEEGWKVYGHEVVIWEKDDEMIVWLKNDVEMQYLGRAELP